MRKNKVSTKKKIRPSKDAHFSISKVNKENIKENKKVKNILEDLNAGINRFGWFSSHTGSGQRFSSNSAISEIEVKRNFKINLSLGAYLFIILAIFLVSLFVYLNFFYFMSCDNSSCFKETLSNCLRSSYISNESILLKNKVIGLSYQGCIVEVISLENTKGIEPGEKMTCYLPVGSKYSSLVSLPQTKIDLCSGSLREVIQEQIISEFYRSIGQNLNNLNSFFEQDLGRT